VLARFLFIQHSKFASQYFLFTIVTVTQNNKLVLFPILLYDAVMETDQAWAASLRRTRHIGDFRAWKDHDPYQKSFERLLRDLKA
jgi:hypothetical protein